MTRVGYLGSIAIAFALGGIGMWAIQGNYKPLLHHVLAQIDIHNVQQTSAAQTPSVTASTHPLAQQLNARQSATPSQPQSPNAQSLVGNSPLQAQSNPFQEMERMQRQMAQQMNRFFGGNGIFGANGISQNGSIHPGGIFNFGQHGIFGNMGSWFGSQTSMGTTITRGEDNHSVYYKMHLGHNRNLSNVKVKVNHGYVSINAKVQNKSRNAFSASTISDRFPVPAGVDPNSAKISKQGDSIVIRFKKV